MMVCAPLHLGQERQQRICSKYPGALFPFSPTRTLHILGSVETLDAFLLQNT